jgi:hypothetical protein
VIAASWSAHAFTPHPLLRRQAANIIATCHLLPLPLSPLRLVPVVCPLHHLLLYSPYRPALCTAPSCLCRCIRCRREPCARLWAEQGPILKVGWGMIKTRGSQLEHLFLRLGLACEMARRGLRQCGRRVGAFQPKPCTLNLKPKQGGGGICGGRGLLLPGSRGQVSAAQPLAPAGFLHLLPMLRPCTCLSPPLA